MRYTSRSLKEIVQLLNNIEKYLKKLDHHCLRYLDEGLSSQEIQENMLTISLQPNEALISLYSWKNGIKPTENINLGCLTFFPGFYLMSLQEGISSYIEFKNSLDWKKTWFPIFANGGGDFYVIDLNEKTNGKIIGCFMYEDEHTVEYNSLELMLRTFEECYEKGIVFKDDQGYLDMDYYEHAAIAHRLNPDLYIWKNILNEKQ